MSFPVTIRGDAGDQFVQSTGQVLPLGTMMVFNDGRKYRYCKAGELLVVAETLQSPIDANNLDMAAAAGSVGDAYISVTSDNANAANFYAEGYIYCNLTGGFRLYQVKSHAVLTSGAGDLIYLASPNGVEETITAGDEFTLRPNPYSNVITHPTGAATAGFVGIAVENIASGSYGWIQTGGPCGAKCVTAVVEGVAVTPIGQAGELDVVGAFTEAIAGHVIRGASNVNETSLIMLTLD